MIGCKFYLLVLEFKLCAGDGSLELGGGLVAQCLVYMLHALRLLLIRRNNRCEFERKRKLKVCLCQYVRLLGV